MEPHRVYFDYNAATPIDSRVLVEYIRAKKEVWGNASSVHREGQAAKAMLAEARSRVARLFSVSPQQVVFFSTATEALVTLIHGLLAPAKGAHVVTSVAEHAAVWQCCRALQHEEKTTTFLKVGPHGAVLPEDLERVITEKTTGITLMSVNNETGVITDIKGCAAVAQKYDIPLLVDGVAHLGKDPFIMYDGVAAACFSSYKIYAPCGVGFAILNQGVSFRPLIDGGGQESGRRGGSENVAAIYACSVALEFVIAEMKESSVRMERLRDLFEKLVVEGLSGVDINGEGPRICNTSNLSFVDVDGEGLLIQLDLAGVAASHGAACASGSVEASRVLLEMGYSPQRAASSLRFSLGKKTTEENVRAAAAAVIRSVQLQRASLG
jgi:cysteine desulfurase